MKITRNRKTELELEKFQSFQGKKNEIAHMHGKA